MLKICVNASAKNKENLSENNFSIFFNDFVLGKLFNNLENFKIMKHF